MKWSRSGVSEEGIDMVVRNWGVLFRLSSCARHEYFSSLLLCQPCRAAGDHAIVAQPSSHKLGTPFPASEKTYQKSISGST